jgi:hypothetical protein
MSFTERNFPSPEPAGETIPDGVRVSLLRWFAQHGITSPQKLWPQFCQREGYGDFSEIAEDISRRFGDHAGSRFTGLMEVHFERQASRMVFAGGHDYNAEPALRALPTPQFLDVLELAVASARYNSHEAVEEINRLFSKRGIYYRFSERSGLAEWHGDQGVRRSVVRPAIDCLRDPRMAGASSEFDAALGHMRSGSIKQLEDAIEESAKSVESAMKVLAREHDIRLTGKETARPLLDALVKGGVVAAESDQAVLAASRLRNAYGGHGAGSQARQIPSGVAELTVASAASAISYLGRLLP